MKLDEMTQHTTANIKGYENSRNLTDPMGKKSVTEINLTDKITGDNDGVPLKMIPGYNKG